MLAQSNTMVTWEMDSTIRIRPFTDSAEFPFPVMWELTWTLNLLFTKGEVGYLKNKVHFHTELSSATFNFRFNVLGPKSVIRPFIFVGGGALLFENNSADQAKSQVDFAAPSFGAGLNVRLGPSIMLNVQEMVLYSTRDNKDGIIANSNDAFLLHTAGITFNFGKKHDEDNDGVADRLDKCKGTPSGVAVDKDGCPLDKDKDGIADYKDACPDLPGIEAMKGCPDKDGDGITDSEDRCLMRRIAGVKRLSGC